MSPTNIRLTLSLITFTNHNHERTLWCGADCGLRTSVACPHAVLFSCLLVVSCVLSVPCLWVVAMGEWQLIVDLIGLLALAKQ